MLDVIAPVTASEMRGGRSPWGGTTGAVEHSRTVTQPMMAATAAALYTSAAAPVVAATAVEAAPVALSLALAHPLQTTAAAEVVAIGAATYLHTGDAGVAAATMTIGAAGAYAGGAFGPSPTARDVRQMRLEQNRQQGSLFAETSVARAHQTQVGVVQELSVKTDSGVRTRIDIAGRDPTTGATKLTEVKSSATAPLTTNQKKAFPEIEMTGATVVGKGRDGFGGGARIPPTKVDIVRPKVQQED